MIIEVGKKYKDKILSEIVTVVYVTDEQVVFQEDDSHWVFIRSMEFFDSNFSEWREPLKLEFEAKCSDADNSYICLTPVHRSTEYNVIGKKFKVTLEEIV